MPLPQPLPLPQPFHQLTSSPSPLLRFSLLRSLSTLPPLPQLSSWPMPKPFPLLLSWPSPLPQPSFWPLLRRRLFSSQIPLPSPLLLQLPFSSSPPPLRELSLLPRLLPSAFPSLLPSPLRLSLPPELPFHLLSFWLPLLQLAGVPAPFLLLSLQLHLPRPSLQLLPPAASTLPDLPRPSPLPPSLPLQRPSLQPTSVPLRRLSPLPSFRPAPFPLQQLFASWPAHLLRLLQPAFSTSFWNPATSTPFYELLPPDLLSV